MASLNNLIRLVIFDFDGVLVDTQQIVNEVEWTFLMKYGIKILFEEFTRRFSGETATSIIERLKKEDNISFPKDTKELAQEIDDAVFVELSKKKIQPIKGVQELLQSIHIKKCVASNGSRRILHMLLFASGLAPYFGENVFSADMVNKPKPSPDLFLYAAHKLNEDPANSLVIEDAEVGVKAAHLAGMRVFGFLGGSHIAHISDSAEAKLLKAGAERVLTSMNELSNMFISQHLIGTNQGAPLDAEGNPSSTSDYELERYQMVEVLKAHNIKEERVLKAMGVVPRHLFVPAPLQGLAYADSPLPIGRNQTISQPYIVALMCQAANLSAKDKVLEVGAGSGYQAAVLGLLSKEVYSVEIIEELGERAREVLQDLDFKNVHIKIGDGYEGWPEHGPYDAILVAAAREEVPQPLIDQLKLNGRLIMPLGSPFNQQLTRLIKTEQGLKKEEIESVIFVPFRREI